MSKRAGLFNRGSKAAYCLALTAFLGCGSLCMDGAAAEIDGSIMAVLNAPATTILPCEPFVLELEIRNAGNQAIGLLPILAVSCEGMLDIFIVSPEGIRLPYQPLLLTSGKGPPAIPVAPGESVTHREMLLYSGYGQGAYAFPAPGEYRVEGTYRPILERADGTRDGSPPVLTLRPLTVHVVAPQTKSNDALMIWQQLLKAHAYTIEGIACSADAEEFLNNHADTPYGQYVRFFLAGSRERRHKPPQPPTDAAAELDAMTQRFVQSAEAYAALLTDAPSFPLADECLLKEAEAWGNAEKPQEALEALDTLLRNYPHSPVKDKAEKQRETAEAQLARIQAEQAAAAAAAQQAPEPPKAAP